MLQKNLDCFLLRLVAFLYLVRKRITTKTQNFYNMETTQQHLFTESEYQIVQASGGKRFANYIIDRIVFYVVIMIMLNVIDMIRFNAGDQDNSGSALIESLVIIIAFALYIFGFEVIFKGKTIGKFITGTRAVNQDGSNISAKTAFLRGLCRLIPFEPFSALGTPSYPWHDSWTRTYVIDEKASNRPEGF